MDRPRINDVLLIPFHAEEPESEISFQVTYSPKNLITLCNIHKAERASGESSSSAE